MKILFRGASHGCGTTSSMTAVASYLALNSDRRAICVQPKEGGGDLEYFFVPWEKRSVLKEESTYYVLEGMDYLIWQEQHHRLDETAMRDLFVPLLDERLFYLPGGSREKPGLYPEQTGELQRRILARMEEYAELIFIDLGTATNAFASNMMQHADVVVINFSGEQRELEHFFRHPIPCSGKVLYLLANYMSDQVYNRDNLQRIYRMDRRSICTLPANLHFAHACTHGRVDQFIKKNCQSHGKQRNDVFFRQLRHVSNLILEAGVYE